MTVRGEERMQCTCKLCTHNSSREEQNIITGNKATPVPPSLLVQNTAHIGKIFTLKIIRVTKLIVFFNWRNCSLIVDS